MPFSSGKSDFRTYTERQKPLEHFRARTRRLKLHPAELGMLWIVGAHLTFLPWAIGGMRAWGQWISFGLSVAGFVIALLPRTYTAEHPDSTTFRLLTWPKLLKFPIFWLGLALLGYVFVQGVNPAWSYHTDGKGWWMAALPHNQNLPTGVDVPFERWGPWRMLLIYTSGWLTVCAIWVGVTRRRTLQLLLLALALNGLLLGAAGVAQRLFGNGKILWFYETSASAFFASFVYKNHAGAYLILSLAVTCGLAAWYYVRGLRRMEKSNPSGVFAFFATFIAISVLTSHARGATLAMLVFLVAYIAAFITHQFHIPSESRKPVVAIALVLVFGFFLKTGLEAVQSGEAWSRIKQGISRQDVSLESREWARVASIEMLSDHWKVGVGAGSFRFLFPVYQHRHPELVTWSAKSGLAGRRMFWEHAHNDILQFPIELGLAGVSIIFLAVLYWAVLLVRTYFWENALSATVVLALLLVAAYSWWDFPFQNPAVLLTWCALWAAAAMWAQFEERNARS